MFMVLFIHLLAKYKLEDRRVEEPHADEVQPHVLEEGQVALGAGDRVLHSCHILKRGVVEEKWAKKGAVFTNEGAKKGQLIISETPFNHDSPPLDICAQRIHY